MYERNATAVRTLHALLAVRALAMLGQVQAVEFHVAPAVAWASDNNPGTLERPWKSIGRGAMLAIAGDTVVIHAGTYLESIATTHNGTTEAPITFRAFADDEVTVDGADTIPAEKWHLVAGTKNIFITPFGSDPGQAVVDGKPFYIKVDQVSKTYPRKYRRGILTDTDRSAYQYILASKSLLINMGGDSPAKHIIRVPARVTGFHLGAHSRLIGIQFSHYQSAGIHVSGDNSLVEDCVVTDSGGGIVVDGWDRHGVALRRNTIVDVQGNGILLLDRPTRCSVEDNLVVRCTLNPAHQDDWMGSVKLNSASDIVFSHNVVLEGGNPETDEGHDGSGFWGDINIGRVLYVGNTCANTKEYGLYVEYSMADTRAYFNAFYNNGNGITCRQSQRGVFMRNLVLASRGSGLAVSPGDAPYSTTDHVFAHNLVRECSPAILLQIEQPNFADYNTYWPRKDGLVAQGQSEKDGTGTSYKQLADWVRATGHDAHSKVQDLQPADVGLDTVTFRVPDAKDPTQILMMVGNSGCEYEDPAGQSVLPYFWRAGSGDDSEHQFVYPVYCGLKGGVDSLSYDGAGGVVTLASDPASGPRQSKSAHGGLRFIKITGQKPEQMCPQGLGFWSPSLPARPSDTFDISYFVRGLDLKPAGGAAVAAFVEFSNATGQRHHRISLSAAPPGSPVLSGAFNWTKLSAEAKVPDDSRRMRFFFGLSPATGALLLDDISIKVR